jgi:tellurite resistance protein TerC
MKKLCIALIGGSVVLVGAAMIVLPGPAIVVIPAGLAILATEFLWARRALRKCQKVVQQPKRAPRVLAAWWRLKRRLVNRPRPPQLSVAKPPPP